MTYTQLISDLTLSLGCKEEDCRQYVAAIVKWLSENIVEKGRLTVADFGRFEVENHKEYITADIGGRTRMLMPPRLTLQFTPSPLIPVEENGSEEGKVFPAMKEMLVTQCKAQQNLAEKLPVAFFKAILDGMDQGDAVEVDQLGEFLLTKVRVGDAVYGKVAFKPHETLAAWVNRPFAYFEPVELRPDVSFDDVETVYPSSPQPEESDDDVFLIYKENQEVEQPEMPETELISPVADSVVEQVPTAEEEQPVLEDTLTAENQETVQPVANQEEEPLDESRKNAFPRRVLWAAVAAAVLCLAGLFLYLARDHSQEVASDDKPVAQQTEAPAIASDNADGANDAKAQSDTLDYAAMNAEIPYGAYDIIGVDTVITVMKGQSLADISRIFLGTDIQIYLTVLNGGNNEPKEGDHYLIPRLRLRK